MIPEPADNDEGKNVAFTPRLATSQELLLNFTISQVEAHAFELLEPGSVSSVVITELEHGTKWFARKSPCALTVPGVPSCFCGAIAIPVEYPGGLEAFPVLLQAPLEERITAVRELLSSPQLHPSQLLLVEQSLKQLTNELETFEAREEIQREIGELETELRGKLTATQRAQVLSDIALRQEALDTLPTPNPPATLADILTAELTREYEEEAGQLCEELHEETLGDPASVKALMEATRLAAEVQALGNELLFEAATEELEWLKDGACPNCVTGALIGLVNPI